MLSVLQNVIPIFGVVVCGYGFGRTRLFNEAGARGLTNFVFYVAVPMLLMRSVSRGKLPAASDLSILLAYFIGALLVLVVVELLGRLVFRRPLAERAIMGMTAIYSNVVLLGIPLIYATFGDPGLLALLLIISVQPMLLMPTIVLLVEVGRTGRGDARRVIGSAARALVRNPVIIGILGGLVLNVAGSDLPVALNRFIDLIANGAPACSLFAVGASLAGTKIAGNLAESVSLTVLKLFVMPLVVWTLATYVFAVNPLWTTVATITAALPTAANTFIFARSYDIYVARATSATVLSTALSAITLTFLLATMGPH